MNLKEHFPSVDTKVNLFSTFIVITNIVFVPFVIPRMLNDLKMKFALPVVFCYKRKRSPGKNIAYKVIRTRSSLLCEKIFVLF